jgi:hypothetical protein
LGLAACDGIRKRSLFPDDAHDVVVHLDAQDHRAEVRLAALDIRRVELLAHQRAERLQSLWRDVGSGRRLIGDPVERCLGKIPLLLQRLDARLQIQVEIDDAVLEGSAGVGGDPVIQATFSGSLRMPAQ